MSITLYGTEELIYVQQHLPDLPDGFWRGQMPRIVTSDREEIMFERVDVDNRKLAPFVSPNVQGRVMQKQGFYARSFKPAYVKPKHVVDPTKAIRRIVGEPLLGGLSMAQRYDYHVAENMRIEREMIERRWDWMACKAISDGTVTVSGDDYPTVTVDFLRDPSLTVTLSGTARWDQVSTAAPLDDLASVIDAAFNLGYAPITDLVFGLSAYKNFLKNAAVLDLLNAFKRGGNSEFNRTPIAAQSNYQYLGGMDTASGLLRMWRYRNWYTDVDSNGVQTVKEYLDARDVVGFGQALEGVQMFGAVMDADANFAAEAAIFPKMWKEEDPSVVYTMSQSAPLMVPTNPNNSFKIRVMS